jgi:hypothetical protein
MHILRVLIIFFQMTIKICACFPIVYVFLILTGTGNITDVFVEMPISLFGCIVVSGYIPYHLTKIYEIDLQFLFTKRLIVLLVEIPIVILLFLNALSHGSILLSLIVSCIIEITIYYYCYTHAYYNHKQVASAIMLSNPILVYVYLLLDLCI